MAEGDVKGACASVPSSVGGSFPDDLVELVLDPDRGGDFAAGPGQIASEVPAALDLLNEIGKSGAEIGLSH